MHELMKCRRCKAIPQHIDAGAAMMTGISLAYTQCLACGYEYTWRTRQTPDVRALLVNEQKINQRRLQRLRDIAGYKHALDQHTAR